jgi:hypothetical protein
MIKLIKLIKKLVNEKSRQEEIEKTCAASSNVGIATVRIVSVNIGAFTCLAGGSVT